MISPMFSVVIPSYNRAHSIEGCVSSVLSQNYQNFEIIIVDDGSTDDTEEVIRNMTDDRIVYIKQKNGGGSRARNNGVKAARGKYIAFLDSDDIFRPQHLDNALKVLELSEKNCTYTQVIVDRGDNLTFVKPHRRLRENEHISEYLMCDRGFVQTSTLIIPSLLAKTIQYDERISAGQDYDFAIKIAHAGGNLIMLDEPGAVWNDQWNEGRLSSRSNPNQRVEWLDRIRPMLTEKAYYAELGWPIAKGLAQGGQYLIAIKYYCRAVLRGCYRPKMAVVIGLQVILSKSAYRKMSDILAKFGMQP